MGPFRVGLVQNGFESPMVKDVDSPVFPVFVESRTVEHVRMDEAVQGEMEEQPFDVGEQNLGFSPRFFVGVTEHRAVNFFQMGPVHLAAPLVDLGDVVLLPQEGVRAIGHERIGALGSS